MSLNTFISNQSRKRFSGKREIRFDFFPVSPSVKRDGLYQTDNFVNIGNLFKLKFAGINYLCNNSKK